MTQDASHSNPSKPVGSRPLDGRKRLLIAATRLFASRGYDGTTTVAVARAAGVAQPLVHHHFGSKEGLWRATMDYNFSQVSDPTIAFGGNDPNAILVQLLGEIVRFAAENPDLHRIITREGSHPSERLNYLLDKHMRFPIQAAVQFVKLQQSSGAINPDLRPELVVFFFIGAATHVFDVAELVQQTTGTNMTTQEAQQAFHEVVVAVAERQVFTGPP